MRINTNMAAMNAWKAMSSNQANLQNSLERLSSGFRINKAADDAAGLAVSEKLQSQMRGMAMATRNTQDAVSMVQTAEGGASKVQDMLQRMRELAVQAGSDTLQDTDRAQLQEEFSSLNAEIDRTANSVQFNGRKLVNGESGSKAAITGGGTGISGVTVSFLTDSTFNTNATQYIRVAVNAKATEQTIAGQATKDNTGVANVNLTGGTVLSDAGQFGAQLQSTGSISITQNGTTLTKTIAELGGTGATVDTFIANLNTALSGAGMSARVSLASNQLKLESNVDGSAGDVTVTESGLGTNVTLGLKTTGATGTVTGGTNAQITVDIGTDGTTFGTNLLTASRAWSAGNTVTGQGRLAGLSFTAASTTGTTDVKMDVTNIAFQVGANSSETISTQFADLRGSILGVSSLSISNKSGATSAISTLDDAIKSVSGHRAKMGALQNRLENTISTLQTQSENITAADSRIRDVDMASEMATFTRFQVLSQASTAMLAQANQLPQGILTLLR